MSLSNHYLNSFKFIPNINSDSRPGGMDKDGHSDSAHHSQTRDHERQKNTSHEQQPAVEPAHQQSGRERQGLLHVSNKYGTDGQPTRPPRCDG